LEILLKKYKDKAWDYLVPYTEYTPYIIYKDSPSSEYFPSAEHEFLFRFFESKNLLSNYYNYIISKRYKSVNRSFALYNYFSYRFKFKPLETEEAKNLALASIKKSKDLRLNFDIAVAVSLNIDGKGADAFSPFVVSHFWKIYGVNSGIFPLRQSLDLFFLNQILDKEKSDSLDYKILTTSLFNILSKINFIKLSDKYISGEPFDFIDRYFDFISNDQLLQLYLTISQQFEAANENYKFYIFSEQLFYPIALFADKSKTGEKLARFFINWYNANWQLNWGKPFLIRRAIGSYPNLKHLIDQRIIDGLSLSQ